MPLVIGHTVTVTDEQRILDALGKTQGLTDTNGDPRSATSAELDQYVQDYLNRMVQAVEHSEAVSAVPVPPPISFA